jgi:membrane associated rhomboid family serine protease
MVIPIYDDLSLRHLRRPIVNWTLIALNIIVFILVNSEIFGDPLTLMRGFAVIPRVLFGDAQLAEWVFGPPAPFTLLTSLFFHSSLLHLVSNMLFLFVFGDNVEDAMGSFYYLLFYFCCGATAGIFYIYATPDSITPLVGASSAISGVCAAFLLLHPRATIAGVFPPLTLMLQPFWLLSLLFGRARRSLFGLQGPLFVFHASALIFIGAWMLLQVMNASWGGLGHVAWMAHVGGIAAGLLLTPFFKRRNIPLFDAAPSKASPKEPFCDAQDEEG